MESNEDTPLINAEAGDGANRRNICMPTTTVNWMCSIMLPVIFLSMLTTGCVYYPSCHAKGVTEVTTLLIILGSMGLLEELWRQIKFYRFVYYVYLVACIVTLWICSDFDFRVDLDKPVVRKYCTAGLFVFNIVVMVSLNFIVVFALVYMCINACLNLKN